MTLVTSADLDWLRKCKDNSGGSCGDGSFDNKARREHNDRIDRLLSAIEVSAEVEPPTVKAIDSVHGVSQCVYDAMRWAASQARKVGELPGWVHGGNSHAQVHARSAAHTIIERIMQVRPAPLGVSVPLENGLRDTFIHDVKSVLKASLSNYDMAAECIANLAAQIDRRALDQVDVALVAPGEKIDVRAPTNSRTNPLRPALEAALIASPAAKHLIDSDRFDDDAKTGVLRMFASDIITDLLAVIPSPDDDYTDVLTTLAAEGAPIQPHLFTSAAPIEAFKPVMEAPTGDTALHVEIGKLVLNRIAETKGAAILSNSIECATLEKIMLRAKERVGADKVAAKMTAGTYSTESVADDKKPAWLAVLMKFHSDVLAFEKDSEDSRYYGGPTMEPKSPLTRETAHKIAEAILECVIEYEKVKSQYVAMLHSEPPEAIVQEPKYRFVSGRVYNRASGESIPLNEPVFVFRGRDKYAALALKGYEAALSLAPGVTKAHLRAVSARVSDFVHFSVTHADQMRTPDTETVAADKEPVKYLCKNRADNGSCPHHNLHCSYPACEQRA